MKKMRSVLFVPGDRPERFDKAIQSGADVIVIDLEDAVLPEMKNRARDHVSAWGQRLDHVVIRTNAIDTPWFNDDLKMLREAGYRSMMLPKTQSQTELNEVVLHGGEGINIYALIETVKGASAQREIAAHPAVNRLIFGSVDFSKDSGILNEMGWLPTRIEMVIASRLAGLGAPIDGALLSWDDENYLRTEAAQSRSLGFAGRLCIHPQQVFAINAGMIASEQELAWANRIVTAFESSNLGAIVVDKKLVDKPVYDLAKAWLAQAA